VLQKTAWKKFSYGVYMLFSCSDKSWMICWNTLKKWYQSELYESGKNYPTTRMSDMMIKSQKYIYIWAYYIVCKIKKKLKRL